MAELGEPGAGRRTGDAPRRPGRHVAVTGASGGIGTALVREFARAGHAVTLVGRCRPRLEGIAREVQGPTHIAVVDLAAVAHATDWIPEAEAALGPIDVLINNAGSVLVGPFVERGTDEIQAVLALDLRVPLTLMRAVLPGMRARRHGVIVNIASTGALAPNPGMVPCCAAKAGLAAASESLESSSKAPGSP